MSDNDIFWADQVAERVISAEQKLKRVDVYRTEMGLGASGIPHVGSAGDGIRSFAVNLALKGRGVKSELIAFLDDRDGLRKIPAGFPESLEKDIGKPVSLIKDPFGCHDNFGAHVSSILTEAFEKLGITFDLKRGSEEYEKGTFDNEIIDIMNKADEAGQIIKKTTGQEKYMKQLPYFPICKECGRVYTTRAYHFDGKKIQYKCDQSFIGKNSSNDKKIEINGCGHEGEVGIREGKLAWKVEFAARWRALKINYEAYGKDILDSVRCNDDICKLILGYEAPLHSFYELFTERSGKKISKSAGNVFTPQLWMKYGSPLSLRLLFLKRLGTSRVVDPDAIPSYMDEVDELAQIYFGKKKAGSAKEVKHNKRLFEYVYFLKPPKETPLTIQYNLLSNLLRITKNKGVVKDILRRTGHITDNTNEKELDRRLDYAEDWINDTGKEEKIDYTLDDKQTEAMKMLADELQTREFTEEKLYARLFEMAKENNMTVSEFFEAAYSILLNNRRGPRLAQFIIALGQKKTAQILKDNL